MPRRHASATFGYGGARRDTRSSARDAFDPPPNNSLIPQVASSYSSLQTSPSSSHAARPQARAPVRERPRVGLRRGLHAARVPDGGRHLAVGERDAPAVARPRARRGAAQIVAAAGRARAAAALLPLVRRRVRADGPRRLGRQRHRAAVRLRSKFPEWTLWYKWFQAIALAAGQRNGGHILKMPNALAFRRNFELIGRLLGAAACWQHGAQLESFRHNGLEHLWLRSKGGRTNSKEEKGENPPQQRRRVVVLYYHGGGYALFSPRFFVEFACRLLTQVQSQLRAEAVDVQVLLANYRKLSEVRFPAPLDDAMAMFDYLVSVEKVSPGNIVLAGDSAGGGLVLATLLRLRRARREMPLAALCNCPYADLSADVAVSEHCFISKSMLDAIRDFCVHAAPSSSSSSLWREGAMLQTDLRGLPPLFVQAAEFDILHRQSLALTRNARSDGVQVELDVHAHMPHVFTLFPHFMMPQSSIGVQRFAAFIARQVQATTHRIPVQLPGAALAF